MAEAHQGVAFSFSVTEDEGLHLSVSFEAFKAVFLSGVRSWRKRLGRLMNQIKNGVYPSHPLRGVVLIAIVTYLKRYKNIDFSFGVVGMIQDKIPRNWMPEDKADLAACTVLAFSTWFSYVSTRKFFLQTLYSYHGWMYESRGSISLKTKVWGTLIKVMVGRNPKLYSYQNVLPYLPLPALKDTVTQYLRSAKPLLDEETYKKVEREAIEFQNGVGRRLQRYLLLKTFVAQNYVSDWWEEYVYLRGRTPIMVNSNFYCLDSIENHSTNVQAARAANCILSAFMYRKLIESEDLEPIMAQAKIPLCSRQYERQFNTTRVPGETTDKLVHYEDSKHVAVYCKGKWFKLSVYYQSKLLNAKELEEQIQKIIDDESGTTKCETYLAALTAGDRVPWAHARKKYFSKGFNKTSLSTIEKAAFVVILDEEEYDCVKNDSRELDKLAREMLHGKGYDRWFDKSFNMIITKNGKCGLNIEHSWADAPVTGHMWEHILADETFKIGYDEKGNSKGTIRFSELPEPSRLRWDFNSKIEESIMSSFKVANELLNDVDLHIYCHCAFGKGFIKKCNLSPDAFIQMALQLAYYKDIGKNHLTYEASMTRLFREGRTETVRSCSIESCEWVKSMVNESYTNKQRIDLLRNACEYHVFQYRNSMTGKGIDRHLFCLYVISKYLEIDIPFLKEILSEPWRLSTSQTPSAQTNKLDFKKFPNYISAGGGFGPVADDGYGVSYIVVGEDNIFFHISSKKSSSNTDSYRFGQHIKEALMAIKELFNLEKKEKEAAKSIQN